MIFTLRTVPVITNRHLPELLTKSEEHQDTHEKGDPVQEIKLIYYTEQPTRDCRSENNLGLDNQQAKRNSNASCINVAAQQNSGFKMGLTHSIHFGMLARTVA